MSIKNDLDISSALYPSEPFFKIDVPGPPEVTGKFVYRYFEPTERYDEAASYIKNLSDRELAIRGAARSIFLEIDPSDVDPLDLGFHGFLPASRVFDALYEEDEFLFPGLFLKKPKINETIWSEFDIQKNGYVKLDFDPQHTEQEILQPAQSLAAEKIKMFQSKISQARNISKTLQESYVEHLSTGNDMVPLIEPSSGQPIKKSVTQTPDLSPTNFISSDFISSLAQSSMYDSTFPFNDQLKQNEDLFLDTQVTSRNKKIHSEIDANEFLFLSPTNPNAAVKQHLISPYSFQTPGETFGDPDNVQMAAGVGIYFIGYLVFKYEIKANGTQRYCSSFLIPNNTFAGQSEMDYMQLLPTTIEDDKVLYGTEYRYFIHTAAFVGTNYSAKTIGNHGQGTINDQQSLYPNETAGFIAYSSEYQRLTIQTEEEVAPLPPSSLKADLIDGFVRLSWGYNYLSIQGPISENHRISQDDLGGVQIFVRHDFDQPYTLLQYIRFSSYSEMPPENIPSDLITTQEGKTNTYELKIRPNKRYIFALATIDLHGNSSNLSEQTEVIYDNVRGVLNNSLVSEPGAPKQYPNLFIYNRMFRDSFSTSAMPYLDIYYHPDTPTVENIKTDSIADYFVHIIDVSAQQDVLMEIDITEPANGIGYFMQGSDNVHFTESDIDLSDRGLGEENGQLPIQQGQPNSNNSNSNNPYV
jgi:hypothetical protein